VRGSGSGQSVLFPRPAWQRLANLPVGEMRLVPDICLAADPNEGAFLAVNGGVTQIGRTSWSAPVWAGFCALLNEARVMADKQRLLSSTRSCTTFVTPHPSATSLPTATARSDCRLGYDLVTGLGAPAVAELVRALTV
jgi:kumamolisin